MRAGRTARPSLGCSHPDSGVYRIVLRPEIVRAFRDDLGRPQREVILHLDGIRSCCLGDTSVRAAWWSRASSRIARLKLSEDERRRVGELLARLIPPVADVDLVDFFEQLLAGKSNL